MFESIKAKLWELLKKKDVSLALLYNREGEILWHKGRNIIGRTVEEGDGFSKSYIKKTINNPASIEEENIEISTSTVDISRSAYALHIKSLIIQPVSDRYFLYLDSGVKEAFSDTDRGAFKVIGELLGDDPPGKEKSTGYRGDKREGNMGTGKNVTKIRLNFE